jgi:hypothetical protein
MQLGRNEGRKKRFSTSRKRFRRASDAGGIITWEGEEEEEEVLSGFLPYHVYFALIVQVKPVFVSLAFFPIDLSRICLGFISMRLAEFAIARACVWIDRSFAHACGVIAATKKMMMMMPRDCLGSSVM